MSCKNIHSTHTIPTHQTTMTWKYELCKQWRLWLKLVPLLALFCFCLLLYGYNFHSAHTCTWYTALLGRHFTCTYYTFPQSFTAYHRRVFAAIHGKSPQITFAAKRENSLHIRGRWPPQNAREIADLEEDVRGGHAELVFFFWLVLYMFHIFNLDITRFHL